MQCRIDKCKFSGNTIELIKMHLGIDHLEKWVEGCEIVTQIVTPVAPISSFIYIVLQSELFDYGF